MLNSRFRWFVNEQIMSSTNCLAIIVLSYNSIRYIDECVDSFLSARYPVDYRLIVADNCSSDGSFQHVLERYGSDPRVTVLSFKMNYGYGSGFMHALREVGCNCRYIAFSNADIVVEDDWFYPVLEAFGNGRAAVVGPVVCYYNDRSVVQGAGKLLRSQWVLTSTYDYGKYFRYSDFAGTHARPFPVFFPDGAVFVFDSSAFWRVGGFDESMFLYREQVDLGLRVWLSGYEALTAPKSRAYHVGGGSTRGKLDVAMIHRNYYFSHRNLTRTVLKCVPIRYLLAVGLLSWFRTLLSLSFKVGSSRDPRHLLPHIRAIVWNLMNLRETLALRANLRTTLRCSYSVLKSVSGNHVAFGSTYTPATVAEN